MAVQLTQLSTSPALDSMQLAHERAVLAAREFRRAEAALIDALIEVERCRVFVRRGYSSLFSYAVGALGLSEAVAYSAITVARKSREVPELLSEIQSGALSVCRAKKIASVITQENHSEWIGKAKTLPTRTLEKEVARENPREATPERATYVSGKRLELSLGLEESLMLELRRAQDQVSRSKNRAVSLEETLSEIVGFYLRHKDPVERAKRVIAKKGMAQKESAQEGASEEKMREFVSAQNPAKNPTDPLKTQFTRPVSQVEKYVSEGVQRVSSATRTPIPAQIQHQVRLRDQGKCQHARPDGTRCGEKRWVEFHHRMPVARGGSDTTENLVTLCRAHHLAHHQTAHSQEKRWEEQRK